MKKWKVRSALVALIVLLAGCSSNAQYNSSASMLAPPGVGMCTQRFRAYLLSQPGVIPAEMIVISYSTNVPSGYDRVYSIRINELEYAIRDGNFILTDHACL